MAMAWQHYRRDGATGSMLVGVDPTLTGAGDELGRMAAERPWSCVVTWRGDHAHPDATHGVEQSIQGTVDAVEGRVMATARDDRSLTIVVRTASPDDAERMRAALGGAVDVDVVPDPGGRELASWVPEGIERQSLDDHRALDELFRAGDVGGPRAIEHTVELGGAADGGRVDELARSLRAVGYQVAADPGVAPRLTVRHEAEPTEVTPDAWTIRQIADRLGAHYAGWRCEVVRPAPHRRAWWHRRRT